MGYNPPKNEGNVGSHMVGRASYGVTGASWIGLETLTPLGPQKKVIFDTPWHPKNS